MTITTWPIWDKFDILHALIGKPVLEIVST